MYKLVNLRTYKLEPNTILIKIDRSSVLGNPFKMHNETERDTVCDQYEACFPKLLKTSILAQAEIDYIIRMIETHENVALGCWCVPKRCHGLTIIDYIHNLFNS